MTDPAGSKHGDRGSSVREHEVCILVDASFAIRRADASRVSGTRYLTAGDPSPAVHAEEDQLVIHDPDLLKLVVSDFIP